MRLEGVHTLRATHETSLNRQTLSFVTDLKVSQHHLLDNDRTISNKYFLKYKDMQEQQSADVPDSHTFEMYAVLLTVNLHCMGHGK